MAHGTLENLSHSSFVRTPPGIGVRIYQNLLSFPASYASDENEVAGSSFISVLDPSAGEGDLLLPLLDLSAAMPVRLVCTGIEISAERAVTARTRLANLMPSIIPSAYEGVKVPQGGVSLAVLNPPYFFVNGQRAEYKFVTRTTPALAEGGILGAILPARSAWNRTMAQYWARWYDDIRVWKMPSEAEGETESPFEKYTQIVVVGRKRATPRDLDEALVKALLAYRWRKDPKHPEEEGWAGAEAPPTLPSTPIDDPYVVPPVSVFPYFDVQNADEALILETLLGTEEQPGAGADLSAEWAQATTWQEEAALDRPAMPYTGVAHVAAEIMTGMLGGEVIELDGSPYLLTAFVGSEWSKMTLDADTKENLRSKGVVSASAKQLQDYPVLGVLNLRRGRTLYYEGTAVFDFLAPHIVTLSQYAQQKRPPLYQLDPEDWELEVLAQFGIDKQLPKAEFPGLAPAQMHRVLAMARSLDERGLIAIQGEPGTGKTRMAIATAARQAYAWKRRRDTPGHKQPAWMRNLRRTWLKNPRTLAMLHLEPVYGERLPNPEQGVAQIREDASTGQIVAYRHTSTGVIVLPEQAGPRALPVLVTTPKKVTKEYEKEIRAAWPQAETVMVQRYTDIPRWLERCADSQAPAVIAICSHSQSQPRGSGRNWQPAVLPRQRVIRTRQLKPEKDLLPDLEPMREVDPTSGEERLVGYRMRATGEILMDERIHRFFLCPECLQPVKGVPDGQQQEKSDLGGEQGPALLQPEEEEDESLRETVTSITWFENRPRWCKCAHTTRNKERAQRHQKPLKSALWTEARTALTQQKYPLLPYRDWDFVIENNVLPDLRTRAEVLRGDRIKLFEKCAREGRDVPPDPVIEAKPLATSRLTLSSEGMASIALPSVPVAGKGAEMDAADPPSMRYYERIAPPPDSFGVYEYLIRFFEGTVALTIVDESHNGRAQNSDIARALHRAMRVAQTHMLTSGTHYGGDIISFYFYWFRFYPHFWKRLGLSWKQASEALRRYGVIQLWTKEYESEARRGSGKSNVQVSTVPAPGLSAKLIPNLLECLCFLTVLDVGAFMPPKIEIPEIVSMRDPLVEEKTKEAQEILVEPKARLVRLQEEKSQLFNAVRDGQADPSVLQDWSRQEEQARRDLELARAESHQIQEWVQGHDLLGSYLHIVQDLAKKARKGNAAARMAQGTIPRWFAVLPCEKPYELWTTERTVWGDEKKKFLVIKTPQLAWNYVYPLERRLVELVQQELSEKRRLMLYIDQNQERSTARRLEWVLQQAGIASWTLPNTVKPEDRQQKIIDAMSSRNDGSSAVKVAIVPYSRVNEGINLQSVVDSIIWYEMALNLFMLEQASRRAWRLGKREEVRIYYLAYAGTAGHQKMRKLGGQSGAAAAFAGEPARGALIEEAGADRTTLARFSETVETELLADDEAESGEALLTLLKGEDADELAQAFARRAKEERETLQRGRTWIGAVDMLPDRLPAFFTGKRPSVWKHAPACTVVHVVDGSLATQPVMGNAVTPLLPEAVDEPQERNDNAGTNDAGQVATNDTPTHGKLIPFPASVAPAPSMPPGRPSPPTSSTPAVSSKEEQPEKLPKVVKRSKKQGIPGAPQPTASRREEQRPQVAPQPVTRQRRSGQNAAMPGTKAQLIFGNDEHIRLARQRRRKGSATKTRVEVEVRDIPAVEPGRPVSPVTAAPAGKPRVTRASKRTQAPVAPAMTLWDFAAKQSVADAQTPAKAEPKGASGGAAQSPQDLWSFVAAEETVAALSVQPSYPQYAQATGSCRSVEVVYYAIWQKQGSWAIRYFVDDHTPVENRYSGFQSEADATQLLDHAADKASERVKITFKEFGQMLLARAEDEESEV
ncbi:DUF6094 domain-containing protein [Dictyobacter formicarum]|uniref:DUF6094 domain-containing protein n=1 Tax=Dictyobacter formicarum TaxID=2778368 RepID=A0ABQ3VPN5_9CHLR|nr:DUF6094 domain-containing protein [Dictyobacter formicarum]GHO88217.1 hypothetical protein KSZ_62230 [Dictyobacter formicarum]